MRNYTIIFILFFQFGATAQNDTVAVFHQSGGTTSLNPNSIIYKNAISTNLIQIIRGSVLLGYERAIGNTGLAALVGVGVCKFDALGQLYLRELSYYYNSGVEVTKMGTKTRPLFDIGIKYYLKENMGGAYFQASLSTITNSVNIQPFYTNDNNNQSTITHNQPLNYRSNDLKLMFGFANKNDQVFFHDFSLGLGYRFITYESYILNPVINYTYNVVVYECDIEKRNNQTFWFFMSWKIGRRI